jgi:rhamnogalacturonyl hydrolase YesR/lysophospholipase L1-like esterase
MKKLVSVILFFLFAISLNAQVALQENYLDSIKSELNKKWPKNRTINLVFHGHSVPTGYFNTPNVRTLDAYPHLTLGAIKNVYPYAAVNVITTSVGGENAEQGAKRFVDDVLTHKPDVLFIDYALNDRGIGLKRARKAWVKMIKAALKAKVKTILFTPTPDLTEDILNADAPLDKHAQQIRELATEYKIGLIDSYSAFRKMKQDGTDLKSYMAQSNHPNEKGHAVVCRLIMQWFVNTSQAAANAKDVKSIMQRVADWQLANFEAQVAKGSQWPNSHAYWAWTNGTMYVGMAEWAKLSNDKKYWDFLYAIGEKNGWKTGPGTYFADDLCVAQMYQQLYEQYKEPKMIQPSVEVLNKIVTAPATSDLSYYAKDSHKRWCWCDALFMAPTVFARFGNATGNKKYFDFLSNEFWATYDSLYSKEDHLFFRDTRYKTMKEANGQKVFWGRGNGWVIGGLTIIIDKLPDDYPDKKRFIALYREMMARLAELQDEKGFWHPSLLDYASYPMPETSASGFITYGLLWGINRGYLDKKGYLPKAVKGWDALCSAVHSDGKPGYVQPIGADPKKVTADDTDVYGVGAFLLAGSEMYRTVSEK